MKKVVLFFGVLLCSAALYAQQYASAVTITVIGNTNLQIATDGKNYTLANNSSTANTTTMPLTNLAAGQHTLLVTRASQNANRQDRISTVFNLRYGYNMLIKLNKNGSLELIETRNSASANNHAPMTNTAFNTLLRNVTNARGTSTKRTLIANTFNNSNNYFTSNQVSQLLQQVSAENYRLQLAKSSYHTVTDPGNFGQVSDLLRSQSSRDDLKDYTDNYYEENDIRLAMADNDFSVLLQKIRQQWPATEQQNSLTSAFSNPNNYFSVAQARQLIQVSGSETNRLQLAKLSYRNITDPANFGEIYNLFSNQSTRNELMNYVNNYNAGNNGNNSNYAMSDESFNTLYQTIRQQWPVSTQMNSITAAFNNTGNYFSTYQVIQLIQLITFENSRLQLAKLSYRVITDPGNFTQVYDLFNSQSSKDELTAYVNNYNPGTNTRLAMADTEFNTLYQGIQQQFFPNEKMSSLTTTFNNPAYYFSCAQARRLIELVSFESNRLQLAKLSYRTISDRDNFNLLFDLFENQSSKNELDAYVKAYKV